jgi:hypothetical protein
MNLILNLEELIVSHLTIVIMLVVWEVIWKVLALWRAAKNNHRSWFIRIALMNTIGILPIIYIIRTNRNNN